LLNCSRISGVNCRAKLQLPEHLLPKSLIAKHVCVPNDGIPNKFALFFLPVVSLRVLLAEK